ncbi:HNH endonuclease signature motif containing protein [Micromonospora endolithica]|nr:HNH endonuclease signature motif containing protein [Micromonospora endolithica]
MLARELGHVDPHPRSQLGIEQVHDMPPRSHARHHEPARPRSLPTDTCIGISTLTDVMGLNSSRHDANWIDLGGCLDGPTLRDLCVSPRSQHSMRALRWDAFLEALENVGISRAVAALHRSTARQRPGRDGHRQVQVRVRVGQREFRRRLLATMGPVCAFTGPGPAAALEAAHLYSYAAVGLHHDDGGLLMRRDLHRLFDQGDIAVDPNTLTINLREDLLPYEGYATLQGQRLAIEPDPGHIAWMEKHWNQHRVEAD